MNPICAIFSLVLLVTPAKEDNKVTLEAFLQTYNADYAAREKANNEAYWKAANTGKASDFEAYAATELALKTLHSDSQRFARLTKFQSTSADDDAVLKRALDVAILKFKGNQLPPDLLKDLVNRATEIEQVFNTYRPTLEGEKLTNNDLLEAIAASTDSRARKARWEALKQVGDKVGPKLVTLARKRNEAARSLGYKNFWEMQVSLQEYDPAWLVQTFDELARATDKPFADMKARLDAELARRFNIKPAQMMPWHYDNPFFQQAPPSEQVNLNIFFEDKNKEDIVALGRTFFDKIGLPAADIVARSDFYEREGKDQHAFCMSVDRAGDVRMLLNVKPTAEWMDTMLHETGHAVYDKFIDRSLPFNLREPAHILTTEGIAMLFGALAKNPTWLVDYAGADPKQVKKLTPALLEQRKREQLIFARWTLVMFNFEKALYENPEQDLNKLWYDLVERFQLLRRPPNRDAADWAAKPHFTIAPVYYHNYLLGELFAAQLRDRLVELTGHKGPATTLSYTGGKTIGRFLIDEIFKPGSRVPWNDFIEKATGKKLGIAAFAEEVS